MAWEPFQICEREFSNDNAKPSFGLANIQAHVPDIEANQARILEALRIFKEKRVNVAVFPEFCLSGYFWEDEKECWPYITAVARADDSFELDYGTTADQDGFEKLMRALSYTKWAGLNPADPNRAAVLSAALDLTREAIGDLSRIRSDVGAKYSVLEQTKLRHQQFMTYADTAI